MRKKLLLSCGMLVAGAALWVNAQPAKAIKNFHAAFQSTYVKADSQDPKDLAFAVVVKEAKCHVCHEGKSKKKRNAYGRELSKLLDKKADKDNTQKIQATLKKVAAMKCNPDDKNSPTFGELIAQGKLPVAIPKKKAEKK